MLRRPLVFGLVLAVGDYLLWNWSLGANHEVIALAAGLTLPPLALISVWGLGVTAARLLGALTRRQGDDGSADASTRRASPSQPAATTAHADASAASASEPASRKIAA